jgi:hypothetical protein
MNARRAGVVVALTLAGIASLSTSSAPPAAAHTLTGVSPTNYRSEITSVNPSLPGVTVSLLDLGRRVKVTNTSSNDVVVVGYNAEPYLRIGPSGVFENRKSPTVYANRTPSQKPPPDADPTAAPDWEKVSSGHSATWRDQRTRWEQPTPAAVQAAPDEVHDIGAWNIELRGANGTRSAVSGQITWEPGPSTWPWIALMFIVAGAVGAIGWLTRWITPFRAAVAAMVVVDVVNAVASVTAREGPWRDILFQDPLTTGAWIAALVSVVLLHEKSDRLWVAVAAGAAWVMAVTSGLNDSSALSQSQLPTDLAPALARAYISLTIALAVGVIIAALAILRPWSRVRVA